MWEGNGVVVVVYMGVHVVCAQVRVTVCVHVEARGHCQVSSSIAPHLTFGDCISH